MLKSLTLTRKIHHTLDELLSIYICLPIVFTLRFLIVRYQVPQSFSIKLYKRGCKNAIHFEELDWECK